MFMYVWMDGYMYVDVFVYLCVCVSINLYVCVWINGWMCVWVCGDRCMYLCMMYICMCVCECIYYVCVVHICMCDIPHFFRKEYRLRGCCFWSNCCCCFVCLNKKYTMDSEAFVSGFLCPFGHTTI